MPHLELDLFHNTIEASGPELEEHRLQAGKLNRKVLDFFRTHSYENYIAHEVYKALGINNHLKSSVQRAITDLTSMNYLEKLDGKEGRPKVQRPGQWKVNCFAYRLK
jgi:hypothetical protein